MFGFGSRKPPQGITVELSRDLGAPPLREVAARVLDGERKSADHEKRITALEAFHFRVDGASTLGNAPRAAVEDKPPRGGATIYTPKKEPDFVVHVHSATLEPVTLDRATLEKIAEHVAAHMPRPEQPSADDPEAAIQARRQKIDEGYKRATERLDKELAEHRAASDPASPRPIKGIVVNLDDQAMDQLLASRAAKA